MYQECLLEFFDLFLCVFWAKQGFYVGLISLPPTLTFINILNIGKTTLPVVRKVILYVILGNKENVCIHTNNKTFNGESNTSILI